jgi:hypothetical protein
VRLRRAIVAAILVASWTRVGGAVLSDGNLPQVRVTLSPDMVKLGEPVRYRVELIGGVGPWYPVQWLAPDTGGAFTWGAERHGLTKAKLQPRSRFGSAARSSGVKHDLPDTNWVEVPLQAFQLGVVPVPGIEFRYVPSTISQPNQSVMARAPTAQLVVLPTLSERDSSDALRAVHGPLAAPWWERVPWRWVAGAIAVLAFVVWLVRAFRRRKRGAPEAPVTPLEPAQAALAALAELRALDLPAHQRHAFRLGQILRRYLEALWPATRPGDTTPELVRHLEQQGLSGEDLKRLAGLLRVWDRVKFAREPFTVDEAHRAESAVESFVRRGARATPEAAA